MRPQRSTTLERTGATVRTLLVLLTATAFLATLGLGSGTEADEPRGAGVTFNNQTIDNGSVVVEQVTLADGGFLVVHGSRYVFDAVESPITASTFLESGSHRNVRISLPAKFATSQMGGQLAVVAHNDDGNRVFEHFDNGSLDVPYRNARGEVVDGTAFVRAPGVTVSSVSNPKVRTEIVSRDVTPTSSSVVKQSDEPRASNNSSTGGLTDSDLIGLAVGGLFVGCTALVLVAIRRSG